MAQEKQRVQFDFAPRALAQLDAMKTRTGAATRAEALRSALRFYDWFLNEFENEREIIFRKGSNGEEVHIPMTLFLTDSK